jgi:hypothetical protein
MKEQAVDATCEMMDAEMDVVREKLTMKLEDVTPEYIIKCTIEMTVGLATQNSVPVLY